MRRALLVAALVATMIAALASAAPVQRKVLASHCSPSGDVCYGVVSRSGAVYFELTTPARYFLRYRVGSPQVEPCCQDHQMSGSSQIVLI